MSIYVVTLSEWYPPGDPSHENAYFLVKAFKCRACGSKARWKSAIGHHSLPFGYGEIWCSWKCCDSGKTHRPDKRQRRSQRRKENREYNQFIEVSS